MKTSLLPSLQRVIIFLPGLVSKAKADLFHIDTPLVNQV